MIRKQESVELNDYKTGISREKNVSSVICVDNK